MKHRKERKKNVKEEGKNYRVNERLSKLVC
jgi:hypothetical protein